MMIFLHGGGDHPAWREATFGRFLQSTPNAHERLALIMVEATPGEAQKYAGAYQAMFADASQPPSETMVLTATPSQPLTVAQLEEARPTAVFVCGGLTPRYHQALCQNKAWLAYLQDQQLPYGGTSAGAAIAAQQAVLGGWQAKRQQQTRDILFEGASEGLDPLTVRPGLGLVPFSVDVHASQMGTLTRLIHAVELGLVPEGWAIDENTAVFLEDSGLEILGAGQAYHVQPQENGVKLTIHTAA